MSYKPSKVRLRFYTAPLHRRSHRVRSALSEDLKSKYGVRSVRVVKGDSVKVVRGGYKGVEGKVLKVNTETAGLILEGVTREKIAGGTVPVKIHSSKVMITSLDLSDKWRKTKLEGSASKE